MTPVLNWRETALLSQLIHSEINGFFLEKIFIPHRPDFPEGYLKREWALCFSKKKKELILIISVRPQHPYFALYGSQKLKASPHATRSPFDLALSKQVTGKKLLSFEAIPKERVVVFWFSEHIPSEQISSWMETKKLGLVITLFPSHPEAILIQSSLHTTSPPQPQTDPRKNFQILARTGFSNAKFFVFPDGSNAPEFPPIQNEWFQSPIYFSNLIEKSLQKEAFDSRLKVVEALFKNQMSLIQHQICQAKITLQEVGKEPNWNYYGDLLKVTLPLPPPLQKNFTRILRDFTSNQIVTIPCDPKLSAQKQVERFYFFSKKKTRKLKEVTLRIRQLEDQRSKLKILPLPETIQNWDKLTQLERGLGVPTSVVVGDVSQHKRKSVGKKPWPGKTFFSQEIFLILVGRKQSENLELTFKYARGNDIWLHIRGRPGAHVVISIPPRKSIPLETLIDASMLAIYYSGGENWGKTEVDYTLRKNVKRIKGTYEVSYTQNKTLMVELDAERIKKLLSTQSIQAVK